jgi:phenol hydroxylase P0 protein
MTNQSAVPKLKKYIRVTGDLNAKFVEFDFAIHDPTLYVELVLPQDAFQKFCQTNEVVEMNEEQKALNDAEEEKWRYGTEVTLVSAQRYPLDHEDQSK